MFNASLFDIPWLKTRDFYIPLAISILLLLVVEWMQRGKEHALDLSGVKNRWVKALIYYGLVFLIIFMGGSSSSFIYFQF